MSNKLGTEENFLNLIPDIYEKPTANILLNSERLNVFPPKIRKRERRPLSPLLFNTILAVLAREIREEEEL